ncbi:MAG: amidohydrolase [Planctomycetota bacterium]
MTSSTTSNLDDAMTDTDRVGAIDHQCTHIWMVRTFLKHADETEDDEDLRAITRDLYDFILAVGPLTDDTDTLKYLRMAKKKLRRLRGALELYEAIQPEVSGHTNFVMAARSLRGAVNAIESIMTGWKPTVVKSNPASA